MSLKSLTIDSMTDVISSMKSDDLTRLKDLLIFRIWAVYLVIRQGGMMFLGAYSSEEKARARYEARMGIIPQIGVHKNIPRDRIIMFEYLLDATKGKQLYRSFTTQPDFNFGAIPITNDLSTFYNALQYAFPGSTNTSLGRGNRVTLDVDVDDAN